MDSAGGGGLLLKRGRGRRIGGSRQQRSCFCCIVEMQLGTDVVIARSLLPLLDTAVLPGTTSYARVPMTPAPALQAPEQGALLQVGGWGGREVPCAWGAIIQLSYCCP